MKIEAKWQILFIISLGIFMSTLDGSILNIANPSIAESLSVNLDTIQWIVTAYMLIITSTLLFFGKIGDNFGSAKVFRYGFLIFIFGSLLCSISTTLGFLIFARIIQGLGASMLMANGIGIISNTFPANERGKALGITGSAVGLGNMAGPGLGGLILNHFSWHFIFLINIPIGLMAYVVASRYLFDNIENKEKPDFNWWLNILFAGSVFLLIFAISGDAVNLLWLFIAISLFIIFLALDRKSKHPFLDYDLFANKTFTLGNIMAFCAYFSIFFALFLLPFYFERILAFTPLISGLFMTILPVSLTISAPLAGSLSDRMGSKKIVTLAFLLMIIAYLILFSLDPFLNYFKISLGLIFLGVGMGFFASPNNSSILGSVSREKAGYTGGFIATIRNFSLALGVVSSATLFTYFFNLNINKMEYTLAYATALNYVFLVPVLICFLAILISFTMSSSDSN